MKKYKHKKQKNWTAELNINGVHYHVKPLNEYVPKVLIENSDDWELIQTLEVGKFYKKNKLFILIKEVIDADKLNVNAIGFDYAGKWSELNMFLLRSDDLVEATEYEWFERLKEEAIKRGLINGVKFKNSFSNDIFTINGYMNISNMSLGNCSETCRVMGYLMDSETGKWATVIEENKPILTTHDDVELFEGDYSYRIDTNFKGEVLGTYTALKAVKSLSGIFFSTPEKAKEYIENNQKRYSLNDVREANKNSYNLPIGQLIFELKKLNK